MHDEIGFAADQLQTLTNDVSYNTVLVLFETSQLCTEFDMHVELCEVLAEYRFVASLAEDKRVGLRDICL